MMKQTLLALVLAAVAHASQPGYCADAREAAIPERRGVAVEPAHLGHVISPTNRQFRFNQADVAWIVTEPPRTRVLLPAEEQAINAARQRAVELAMAPEQDEVEYASGLKVAPLASVYFPFNSSRPLDLGPVLGLVPQLKLGSAGLALTGYADQKGSDAYNLTLSTKRADSVGRALVRAGIAESRIDVKGMGKAIPADADPANDRRVDLTVLEAGR